MSEKLRVAARLLLGRRNSVVRESSGAGRHFTLRDTMSRPKKKKGNHQTISGTLVGETLYIESLGVLGPPSNFTSASILSHSW